MVYAPAIYLNSSKRVRSVCRFLVVQTYIHTQYLNREFQFDCQFPFEIGDRVVLICIHGFMKKNKSEKQINSEYFIFTQIMQSPCHTISNSLQPNRMSHTRRIKNEFRVYKRKMQRCSLFGYSKIHFNWPADSLVQHRRCGRSCLMHLEISLYFFLLQNHERLTQILGVSN